MADKPRIELVRELALKSIHIVGYQILGCSQCPFSKPSLEFGEDDVNISDPDEGHYDCELLDKKRIWGEGPVCEDTDWLKYILEFGVFEDRGLEQR